jgi:predicted nucleotidyltransferase component of viral defense system
MQLKSKVKKIAFEKNISAQLVLQNYMLERLLSRIAYSKYHDFLIIKGGLLIASLIGLNSRTTMDLDLTIKNIQISELTLVEMIKSICLVECQDGVQFEYLSIIKIRISEQFNGYRFTLNAKMDKLIIPIKIDVTFGDDISPSEISYSYPLLFEDRSIKIMAYNIETIFAEKIETILSRSDQNTRSRDYYDVYMLFKLKHEKIDWNCLQNAILETSKKRGTLKSVSNFKEIIETIRSSDSMKIQWKNYQSQF